MTDRHHKIGNRIANTTVPILTKALALADSSGVDPAHIPAIPGKQSILPFLGPGKAFPAPIIQTAWCNPQ